MLILQNGVRMSVFHDEIMEDSKTRREFKASLLAGERFGERFSRSCET
jgi:hypothetical protein